MRTSTGAWPASATSTSSTPMRRPTRAASSRRGVFLRYGGFDERYRTASVEDQEFSFRLAADGHKMVFNPRAVVWHRHVRNLSAYLRKKYKIGFWKGFM